MILGQTYELNSDVTVNARLDLVLFSLFFTVIHVGASPFVSIPKMLLIEWLVPKKLITNQPLTSL